MLIEPTSLSAKSVTGNNLVIHDMVQLKFQIDQEIFPHFAYIVGEETSFNAQLLLGVDFLSKFQFNLSNNHLVLNNEKFLLQNHKNDTNNVSFITSNPCKQTNYLNDHTFGVKVTKTQCVRPKHTHNISIKVPKSLHHIYENKISDVLFTPKTSEITNKYLCANSISRVKDNQFMLSLIHI